MHHRIYVGPFDAVDVLGVVVARGEQVEVTAEEAAALDRQPSNWAKPTTTRGRQAAADPADPPVTPPLQPPPVGEEQDDQDGDQDDAGQRPPATPTAADTAASGVAATDTQSPAPGDGDDDTQEAGQ